MKFVHMTYGSVVHYSTTGVHTTSEKTTIQTFSLPITSSRLSPGKSSMTTPAWRQCLSWARAVNCRAGTKGLLQRLPPSSTSSWNLTQLPIEKKLV